MHTSRTDGRLRTVSANLIAAVAGWLGGAAAWAACTPLPATLPTPTLETFTDPNGTIQYYMWDNDFCYGDGLAWREWNAQNDWSAGYRTLWQQFDFYRPASLPLSQKLPLIIFAHPGGAKEGLVQNGQHRQHLLVRALRGGYAFASIEFRHPIASFVDPASTAIGDPVPVTTAPIPSNDVSTAVRYMKFAKTTLDIDAAKVFVVGQSRGSLALLNALRVEDEVVGATDWKSKSSRVQAALVYQAQTTYDEDELATTFVLPNGSTDDELYRYWFRQDTPDVIVDAESPGSAAAKARSVPPTDLIPVRMTYDFGPVLQTDGHTIKRQCYQSENDNRALQGFDNNKNPNDTPVYNLPRCPGTEPREIFDIHDPNYGQHFAQAYADRAVSDRLIRCVNIGEDNVDGAYVDMVSFFNSVLNGTPLTPSCSAGVLAPSPPASAAAKSPRRAR